MKLVECPRDAMQGIHEFIPTRIKAQYINKLLNVGFDTIDFGSFVSPRAVPQLSDTAKLMDLLIKEGSNTKLLAIVANNRGGDDALAFDQIDYLGFPFSVSETFQLRNTNAGIEKSLHTVEYLSTQCKKSGKEFVVYISMGFGNPYGDDWNDEVVIKWISELVKFDIRIFSIADTVGIAKPETVSEITGKVISEFPELEIGVHLHCRPDDWYSKVDAAYKVGCRRFDSAMLGYGGCPFAGDELTGNLSTGNLLEYLREKQNQPPLNLKALREAQELAVDIFQRT